MKKLFIALAPILLLIASCNKEGPSITTPAVKGVYVTNEGNFNFGNGEISFYDPSTQQVSNNLFKNINHYNLGDVVQSMYIKDSTGYIVVNNSSKIEVVKIPSLQHIRTITIPNSSPRYFLPVNDSTAYITDLYAGKIHVVNYVTGSPVTDITGVATWTEHLCMVNNKVVVEERNLSGSTPFTGSVVAINPVGNTVIQHYNFAGSNTDGLVTDYLGRVWIGMDADTTHQLTARLYCLNTDMTINKTIVLNTGHTVSNLAVNGGGTKIYYFDTNGVNALAVSDTIAPASALIPAGNRNLYGLGINPANDDIYLSDALDYVQPSNIYRYDKNAVLIQSFSAGIISGNFAFSNE